MTDYPATWKEVVLPHSDRIIAASEYQNGNPLSLHDINHNIFRLDAKGNVVWQIKRDEQGKLNWEAMNKHAIEDGFDGARWPFENLLVVHPDGTRIRDPKTGLDLKTDYWQPGCKIYSGSAQGQTYEIDIEQGVARNVTVGRQRPW